MTKKERKMDAESRTVLLVDHDVASRAFLTRVLRERGIQVLQAGTGKEGLIFAWRDRPAMIIADPSFTDIDGKTFIQKLRNDARTAYTPVIALSKDSRPGRLSECLRNGYDEYLVKSGKIIEELLSLVSNALGVDQSAGGDEKRGMLLTFLSAKGGTGTSSVCANVAVHIAEQHPKESVVVVDMVLPIGSIGLIVDYQGTENIVTIADIPPEEITPDFLRETLPKINTWNFHLLAGSPNPEMSNSLQIKRVPHILDALRRTFDYVVVDLGRSLSRITLPIVQQADAVVMIVTTDLSTVTLTKTVLDYLESKGVSPEKIYPMINRVVGLEGLMRSDVEEMLGKPIRVTVPYMGGSLTLANNQHQPLSKKSAFDSSSIAFQQATLQIVQLAEAMRAA
jgi:pilus assembly protein CpaE